VVVHVRWAAKLPELMGGSRVKSVRTGIVAALVALLLPAGVAEAGNAHIRIGNTPAGEVLTNGAGYVLLMFPREGNSLAICMRIRSCMTDWPPVTTTGRLVAGRGIDVNMLGTIPYRGKLRAVTYAGWPLHTYRFAYSAKNSVINIGVRQFGDQWDALGPAGEIIT
jgi:predicted lipoprotein with Yx(FWY)xxD motif